jgi:transcriptional antiterminator NusG
VTDESTDFNQNDGLHGADSGSSEAGSADGQFGRQPESDLPQDIPSEGKAANVDDRPAPADSSHRDLGDPTEGAEDVQMAWYILKVQSNREDSICQALKRRVAMEGLDRYFDEIIVPKETVSEFKNGKKRVVQRKLYPGYIVVHMALTEDTWFLVRETPGIGDFTGAAGKPTPMLPHEVQRIVSKQEETSAETPKLRIGFQVGDKVKINEGTFDNFEGEVETIDEANGRVTVIINIFGRSTPVELEYWQVESV